MSATTLAAGRELDALVAEKVMGWTSLGGRWTDANRSGYEWRFAPLDAPPNSVCSLDRTRCTSPAFSTEIEAAWCVVQRLVSLNYVVEINVGQEFGTAVVLAPEDWNHPLMSERADTTPLAICRAALAAMAAAEPTDGGAP